MVGKVQESIAGVNHNSLRYFSKSDLHAITIYDIASFSK